MSKLNKGETHSALLGFVCNTIHHYYTCVWTRLHQLLFAWINLICILTGQMSREAIYWYCGKILGLFNSSGFECCWLAFVFHSTHLWPVYHLNIVMNYTHQALCACRLTYCWEEKKFSASQQLLMTIWVSFWVQFYSVCYHRACRSAVL